jgi:hypothetical protein
MAQLLLILGRSIGFTAAVLSAVLAVGWGYFVISSYPNPLNPAQSDAAQILLFDALRLVGAVWVMWSALKKGAVHLLLALFIVGVGSFIGLFSFYIMIMGMDGGFISFRNIPYLLAICELLYIAVGFVVGWAVLWIGTGSRTNNDRQEAIFVQAFLILCKREYLCNAGLAHKWPPAHLFSSLHKNYGAGVQSSSVNSPCTFPLGVAAW